jgi:hypothetical protein
MSRSRRMRKNSFSFSFSYSFFASKPNFSSSLIPRPAVHSKSSPPADGSGLSIAIGAIPSSSDSFFSY